MKLFFVIQHNAGPKWINGIGFREQPDVRLHIEYMMSFLKTGELVLGGPFMDDNSGMAVFNVESMEEAERIAQNDPAVQIGLLVATVKQWYTHGSFLAERSVNLR